MDRFTLGSTTLGVKSVFLHCFYVVYKSKIKGNCEGAGPIIIYRVFSMLLTEKKEG